MKLSESGQCAARSIVGKLVEIRQETFRLHNSMDGLEKLIEEFLLEDFDVEMEAESIRYIDGLIKDARNRTFQERYGCTLEG